jgi:hypothetical protein
MKLLVHYAPPAEAQELDIEIEPSEGLEVLKLQVSSLTVSEAVS